MPELSPSFDHTVQFYESESFLHSTVAGFLAQGLTLGQPTVVVATADHRDAFEARLKDHGFDVRQLPDGALIFVDAREALARVLRGSQPDPALFQRHVGGLIDRSRSGRPDATVRAYGELVELLWQDGNPEGALRIEELWNELATSRRLSLLCGYAMGHFHREAHWHHFDQICSVHAHVRPAEGWTLTGDEDTRLREITRLQQRARSLEAEIAYRVELEQKLRHALAERERAERIKDEFLAILSHELRTPLNAILGWTHIATTSGETRTIQRALKIVHRNAALQLHVIDDLLDVSRILTGKMTVKTATVDLVDVLQAAIESVRPAAVAKGIEIASELDPDARGVLGDRDRLQQVAWNLLSNAIKFTPAGGLVELRLERTVEHAHTVVRDSGRGIAPDFLPYVFERFRQEEAGTTRAHGGLGLGLAVVRYLVEAHGGTVRAESDGEGLGATFTVALPLHSAESPEAPDERPAARSLNGIRILLVDDDEDTRELFSYALADAGAAVLTATSTDEAMALVEQHDFDVLIGDIGLPHRDGFNLIESIRSHRRKAVRAMRAIAATSYAGDHYRARALAAGYDEYVAKPVAPDRLVELVAALPAQR